MRAESTEGLAEEVGLGPWQWQSRCPSQGITWWKCHLGYWLGERELRPVAGRPVRGAGGHEGPSQLLSATLPSCSTHTKLHPVSCPPLPPGEESHLNQSTWQLLKGPHGIGAASILSCMTSTCGEAFDFLSAWWRGVTCKPQSS